VTVTTKVIYQEFQDNPDLEFEFQLAERLSTTVGDLRTRMGSDEYERWKIYFGREQQRRELANGGR